MNQLISNLLIIILLCVPIYGLTVNEENIILGNYKNPYSMLEFYGRIQMAAGSNEDNICLDLSYLVRELKNSTFKDKEFKIHTKVIRGLDGHFLTLDGRNYVLIPAVIRCSAEYMDDNVFNFYFIIMREENSPLSYIRVFEDGMYHNRNAYIETDANNIRMIKNTYEDDFETLKAWYISNQDKRDNNSETCNRGKTYAEDVVEYGDVMVGEYILVLDEKWWVPLPGMLICVIRHPHDVVKRKLYVIKNLKKNHWFRIYHSKRNIYVLGDHITPAIINSIFKD